jgi:uncharacterized protein
MLDFLSKPWPWYISGPLLGLMVPVLLLTSNKPFGVSSSLRHICAAVFPGKPEYLKYKWKEKSWSLVMMLGVIIGALLAVFFLDGNRAPLLSDSATAMFALWGLDPASALQPAEVFSLSALGSPAAFVSLIAGGFLVGFGTRYSNGCTSGHAIMGISMLNPGSIIATISFFAGGTLVSNFIVPLLFH